MVALMLVHFGSPVRPTDRTVPANDRLNRPDL
jgi:hypothetical protein